MVMWNEILRCQRFAHIQVGLRKRRVYGQSRELLAPFGKSFDFERSWTCSPTRIHRATAAVSNEESPAPSHFSIELCGLSCSFLSFTRRSARVASDRWGGGRGGRGERDPPKSGSIKVLSFIIDNPHRCKTAKLWTNYSIAVTIMPTDRRIYPTWLFKLGLASWSVATGFTLPCLDYFAH